MDFSHGATNVNDASSTTQTAAKAESNGQGLVSKEESSRPRTIHLQKCENGYGFTLRYFVVYPPESVNEDNCNREENAKERELGDAKTGLNGSADTMDTIFVKHVKEGSEAHKAGLATGDRIVSVNGQPVSGKSYNEVLNMIQNCENNLQLLVVPKEDDILQLYFSSSAYDQGPMQQTDPTDNRTKSSESNVSPRPSTVTSSALSYHAPAYSQSRIPSAFSIKPTESKAETPQTSYIMSQSIPSNYFSQCNSSVPQYGNLKKYPHHPCPPPYGYHAKKLSTQVSHPPADSYIKPITPEPNENILRTSRNNSINSDPSDIAYQHQSLVNRKKEEFLCNNIQPEPLLPHQPWSVPKVCKQSNEEPNHVKTTSVSSFQSEPELSWNSESAMLQSWPSVHSSSEPTSYVSFDLASVKSSINNSQLSLLSADSGVESKSSLNKSASVDHDQKYARSFVSTLSKIQEHLTSSTSPRTNQSHDQLDRIVVNRKLIESDLTLRKASSLDSEVPSSQISSSSLQSDDSAHINLVSQRTKQFETGSQMWEEEASLKRNFYKNELARISSHCKTPRVVERTAKYENMSAASSQETISTIPDNDSRNRTSAEIEAKFCHHLAKMGIITPTVVEAAGLAQTSITTTPTTSAAHPRTSARSRNYQLKKSKAVRQNSYLTAVSLDDRRNGVIRQPNMVSCNDSCQRRCSEPYLAAMHENPSKRTPYKDDQWPSSQTIKRSVSASDFSARDLDNNDFFGSQFESLLDDGAISNLIAAFDSMLSGVGGGTPAGESASHSPSSQGRIGSPTGVVLRKKALYESNSPRTDAEDDDEEARAAAVRRVSYLKATSTDVEDKRAARFMQVASNDHDSADQLTPRSHHHIHSIQKLKSFFGERTPQIVEASEKAQQPPSPTKESPTGDVVREGLLNCKATLVDGKRASDRSWKPVWAILRGHALYFYRDKKDANHSPVGITEEHAPINVKSCIVDIAYDYTKKKNVFRLTTFGVSEFLLQADDNDDMLRWIKAIQDNSNPDNDHKGIGNQNLILRKSSEHQLSVKDQVARLSPQATHKTGGIMKLNFRTRSPTATSTSSSATNTQTFVHSPLPAKSSKKTCQADDSSPKSKTWRGKMVKSLRKFQGSSTTTVPNTEGNTIGVLLEDCPVTVHNEFVPLLVELCTKIVEAKGLEIVGIYRIPGNNASVAALQDAVNKGFENLNLQDPRWNDVNVISSLLKAFFRQLPEPLFTGELYPLFIEANKLQDNNQRMLTLKKLIHELPDHHYETLNHLMKHLANVVNNSHINKMEARNLAIVFGPNLVRTADNNMVTMVTDMSHQCKIVETVVSHAEWFFSDSLKPFAEPPASENVSETSCPNTDLLLGNIDRLEDMNADLATKDIISNIISAANKKVKVKNPKKNFDERDIDQEIEMRRKCRRGSAPSESISVKLASKGCDWLRADGVDSTNSTLSSSSRTLSSQTLSEDSVSHQSIDTKPSNESLDRDSTGSKAPPNEHSNQNAGTSKDNVVERFLTVNNGKATSDRPPPYTLLSPSTQERIKRFEAETKAMLQRELPSRRVRQESERYRHELDRQRIEMEWQQAKRDMEQDDFLDELADNPCHVTRKMSDLTSAAKIETSDYSSSSASPVTSDQPKGCNQLPPKPTENRRVKKHGDKSSAAVNIRRGVSAENIIDLNAQGNKQEETPVNKNLAVKYGGSLDSLRETYSSRGGATAATEDGELLTSIKSTLDPKLQALLSCSSPMLTGRHPTKSHVVRRTNYRDPSLYRGGSILNQSAGLNYATPPLKSIYRDPSMHRQNRPNNRHGIVGNEQFLLQFNNNNDEQLSCLQSKEYKKMNERPECDTFRREHTPTKTSPSSKNMLKISPATVAIISYSSKDQKTENNMQHKAKLQSESARKPRRRNLPLKRRHTVAGVHDFGKFKWLLSNENSRCSKEPRLSAWERLQPIESTPPEQRSLKSWLKKERLRISSPDLRRRMSLGGFNDSLGLVCIDIDNRASHKMPAALESLV